MIKKCLNTIFFIGLSLLCLSQYSKVADSTSSKNINKFKKLFLSAKDDSSRIIALDRIGFFYQRQNADSSLKYFNAALNLATQKSLPWAEARVMAGLSGLMEYQGKYAEAFELLFKSLKIAEENNLAYDIARANRRISGVYEELQNYPNAIAYLLKALQIDEANHYPDKVAIDHYALADAYEKINNLDSATLHVNFALKHKALLKDLMQYVYPIDGHIKRKKGNYEQAVISYQKGFEEAQMSSDLIASSQICADFSDMYLQRNLTDSAIFYALKGFNYSKEVSFEKGVMQNGYLLAELYDSIQPSLALKYFKVAANAEKKLFGVNNIQTIQNLLTREEAKQKELENTKIAYRARLRLFALLTGLAALIIIAFIQYRNNRQKQKANTLLQQQKNKVETTLSELKSTQAQLIHSEKMASLGELTAGIAHEIQNPLNFVNNFSEVNTELIEELKSEKLKVKSERDEQLESELLNDIAENEKKINHHGKRADAIVKGMLQHSRSSTGQKEQTNINALADEYLRLSYHGFRGKDKAFNATLKTDYDENIGKINIIPQDIGRVLLNLITNAFYAVGEKQKAESLKLKAGGEAYEPTISVSTKRIGSNIEIRVADNGNGIAQKIVEKIFQPFFTTKPTGQGTGLGLSLSYDIVKAHGGEIKVETKEGKGSTFTIILPFA